MRRQYVVEKDYTVAGMWEYEWWKPYKTDVSVEKLDRIIPIQTSIAPIRAFIAFETFIVQDKIRRVFHVQCDIKVPEHLREKSGNFPPIFKNTNVCRQNFGQLMQEYAEKKRLLSHL